MIARRLMTALVLALAVSGLFTFWLSRKLGKSHTVNAASHRYVAASQNLDPGSLLATTNLKMVDWPTSAPLDGSFIKPEDIVGRTLLYPIANGQPILERDLSAAGAGIGLSAKIPDGMRAISLRDDEIVGVAGFLLPGTHVDVLVTYRSPTGTETITSIVLQDVQVLAAGQKTQADPDGKAATSSVVTLLVSPSDAEKLTQASTQGTVHFVLRNGADRQHVEDEESRLGVPNGATAPSRDAAAPAAPRKNLPERQPYVVQTMRGDKVTEEKFQ